MKTLNTQLNFFYNQVQPCLKTTNFNITKVICNITFCNPLVEGTQPKGISSMEIICEDMGCQMLLKICFLHSHIDFFL